MAERVLPQRVLAADLGDERLAVGKRSDPLLRGVLAIADLCPLIARGGTIDQRRKIRLALDGDALVGGRGGRARGGSPARLAAGGTAIA